MIDYPKMLYLAGWEALSQSVVVSDGKGELAARALGYRSLGEPTSAAKDEPDERDVIAAELTAQGIDFDRRLGAVKLRELLG